MKRVLRAAAWALLGLLALAWPATRARLPVVNEGQVQARHAGFAGVLRLWTCEGWQAGAGSLAAWLNACIARYERLHPGVYVQCTQVSEETIAAFWAIGDNPPDLILFAPGMLGSAAHLLAIEDAPALLPGLETVGTLEGVAWAAPVAMGGYVFAVNERLLEAVPDDLATAPAPSPPAGASRQLRQRATYLLSAPADGRFVCWSGALLSLLGARGGEAVEKPRAGEGLDLGLGETAASPAPEVASGEAAEEPEEETPPYGTFPLELPSGFREESSVYAAFTAGTSAMIPVTQREIRRLQLLEDTGRAPEWRAEASAGGFTDQLAMLAAVDWPRESGEARASLSLELIRFLLSEESQAELTRVRALSVLPGASLYASQRGMAELEAAYRASVLAPNAFDGAWRENARHLADQVQRGDLTASQAFEALAARLRPQPSE